MIAQTVARKMFALTTLLVAAAASASPVGWSNASGSAADYSWVNGASDGPLVGSPFIVNGFTFAPSGYAVTAIGNSSSLSEAIHVTLIPDSGRRISSITAHLTGDYSILGPGSVGYSALLDVAKHGSATHVSNSIPLTGVATHGSLSDIFDNSVTVNIPLDYSKIDITLDAPVQADSQQGAVAFIQMKLMDLTVQTETAPSLAVPLPAALVSFPGGAIVAALAARRMKARR